MSDEVIECILDSESEDCQECRYAVGVGQATSICKHAGYDDCDKLSDMVLSEEISPVKMVDMMIERAKESGSSSYTDTFESIKELMTTHIDKMVIGSG